MIKEYNSNRMVIWATQRTEVKNKLDNSHCKGRIHIG